MEFVALDTIAEVGAALAGFATLAGAVKADEYESDNIFGIVANSIVALVFSLLASRFGAEDGSLRILAVLLLIPSSLLAVQAWRVSLAARAASPDFWTFDGTSILLGLGAMLLLHLPAPLSVLVAVDAFPGRGRMLYEAALIANLSVAGFLMVYLVWRNFGFRATRESPAGK